MAVLLIEADMEAEGPFEVIFGAQKTTAILYDGSKEHTALFIKAMADVIAGKVEGEASKAQKEFCEKHSKAIAESDRACCDCNCQLSGKEAKDG